uniref:Uncharacterized protein n=1 Tax=viral metagenome TaxID=1070528 RepID=A0A6M3LG32_9ZZZZ
MATKKATKTIVSNLQEDSGKEKLGYVVWWALERVMRVVEDRVKKIFTKYGFDEKEFPEVCSSEVAFTRALSRAKRDKLLDKWLIRKIFLGDDKIVYGIVKEKIDKDNEDLDYKKEDKITLKRKTEDIQLENNTPQGQLVKKFYGELRGILDNYHLMVFLLQQVKVMNALQLRDTGGIYFLPIQYEERVLRIEKALAELSPESTICLLPIYKDDRAKKSLTMSFDENFQAELEAKADELKKRIESEGTRASTFNNRLNEFKELRQKAQVYEDLLNFKAGGIHKKIGELEQKVKKALMSATMDVE